MSRYRGPPLKKIRHLRYLHGRTCKKPTVKTKFRNQSCLCKKSQYRIRLEEKKISFS